MLYAISYKTIIDTEEVWLLKTNNGSIEWMVQSEIEPIYLETVDELGIDNVYLTRRVDVDQDLTIDW